MANDLLTTDILAKATLAKFRNRVPFLMTADRSYEGEFQNMSYRPGQQIRLRRRVQYKSQNGPVLNPQSTVENFEYLVVDQNPGILLEFDTVDLALKIDDFADRYLDSVANKLVNDAEIIIANASNTLSYYTGSTSSPINSFAQVQDVGDLLLNQGVDMNEERYLSLSIRNGGALKTALQNNFNQTLNTNISLRSALGNLAYFDIFNGQTLKVQTAGNFGAGPITTTALVASGSTIPMTGLTPSTTVFRQGDIFSINGVFNVNPLSYFNTQTAQFVVTADVTSDGGGNAVVPVSVAGSPIITDPSNPYQNVNVPIPSGSTVVPVGSHRINVAYVKSGLSIVMPPLERLMTTDSYVARDEQANISLRMSQQGDITNGKNFYRVEFLMGVKWHPQYCARLISDPTY